MPLRTNAGSGVETADGRKTSCDLRLLYGQDRLTGRWTEVGQLANVSILDGNYTNGIPYQGQHLLCLPDWDVLSLRAAFP